MSNDEKARKARAMRLRKQIKQIVEAASVDPDDQSRREDPPVNHVSPREFIHRRMRELDSNNK